MQPLAEAMAVRAIAMDDDEPPLATLHRGVAPDRQRPVAPPGNRAPRGLGCQFSGPRNRRAVGQHDRHRIAVQRAPSDGWLVQACRDSSSRITQPTRRPETTIEDDCRRVPKVIKVGCCHMVGVADAVHTAVPARDTWVRPQLPHVALRVDAAVIESVVMRPASVTRSVGPLALDHVLWAPLRSTTKGGPRKATDERREKLALPRHRRAIGEYDRCGVVVEPH